MKALCSPYVQIRGEYEEYKNFIINAHARKEDEIKHTHDWHTTLLKKLGYDLIKREDTELYQVLKRRMQESKQEYRCPQCGNTVYRHQHFCDQCGTRLDNIKWDKDQEDQE